MTYFILSGHVYSVLASLESTVPLICTPTYNLIYEATIDVFPGCVFVVAASLNFVVLLLLRFGKDFFICFSVVLMF